MVIENLTAFLRLKQKEVKFFMPVLCAVLKIIAHEVRYLLPKVNLQQAEMMSSSSH